MKTKYYFLLIVFILFSYIAKAQTVTITQPNGGEVLYSCQTYTIKWSQTGSPSNYWNIDYSINGGTTWASVTTSYLATNGQYVWTVPQVQSSTALIRITDAQHSTTTDQSNAAFTINIPVTVTSPNGGEVWQGNTTHTITWNALGTSNSFKLEYTADGGSTWNTISSGVTGTSYSWLVPNISSTLCQIRVTDNTTSCMTDVSNANFTINYATPVLLTPNGGEVLQVNCGYNITWDPNSYYSAVRLDYSTDNGTTWTNITTGASNNGSYSWVVPNTVSSQYIMKASNSANVNLNDVSNATFTVATPVTVTSPNGGETWNGCSTYTINFSKSTCISYFNIYYSVDSGATWNIIASQLSNNGSTAQTVSWQVPNTITSAKALIKVADYYNTTVNYDISNAVFNIIPSTDVTVASPNGGESWVGLSTHTLTWTNLSGASGQYSIYYSTDGGSSWNTIATNVTGNAYIWTLPNISSTQCQIKVMDYINTCKYDVSNANFTITPAAPILLAPNGGEVLQQSCTYNITWNSSTFYSSVRLDYSSDNGVSWTNITTGASNNGSYSWAVPSLVSSQYLIKASDAANLAYYDVSNATFSVATPITVTSPNGGETFYGCSTYNISFSKSTCISYFNVYYSLDSAATWNTISSQLTNNGSTTQSVSWLVPNGITTTKALIKVCDYYNPTTTFDISNAVFNISPSNDITVTSPNGGESWVGLSTHTLTWSNLPSASGQYSIYYSSDGGSSWNSIATNISGNTYSWTAPNNPTTYLIKVMDYVNTCKYDISNANFTITPATPILLTPNGGEVLQQSCTYNITWNANTFYSSVRLDYSSDNGLTWTNITTGASNSGSYSWSVPSLVSTQYLIKASNAANLSYYDVSNATFSVATPITVTSPNGGETFYGCSTYNITFNKSTCISYFNVYYSLDSAATWNTISSQTSNNGSTTQSVSWLVPNGITSTKALIKVSDYNTPTRYDISDAVFNISPSNDITVTSPNGGESWVGLSTHTLTWSNLPTASGQYSIYYSTDGGSSWNSIASNISGNTYSWTLPNIPSTLCQIKVMDYVNTCKYDVSNANFTITPAAPILLTPNGGEVLQQSCTYNITWNANTFYSSVRLDYSSDNGLTWTNITTGASNNGSYSWSVPSVVSSQYLIKASNTSNLTYNDMSNAPFSVAIPITVTSPNGGETFYGCSTYNITFNKSTCISYFNVYYSLDSAATWNTISSQTSNNGSTTQSVSWLVPNGITTTKALIKVSDYYTPTRYDISDAVFNISPSNDITVTSPNGGESWVGLSTHTLTWSNLPTSSGQYSIYYSTDGGSSWNSIATNISGNTYSWTLPNIPSALCQIKVMDYVNTCKYDVSNANFTITPATPILLTPNGGEVLQQSCTYNITWNANTFYSSVRLDYSSDNGLTWTNITTGASNNGSYTWSVPSVVSSQYLIKASNASNLTYNDVSAATFSVATPITVTSPNGGENFYGCSTYNISFSKSTCISYFNVYYSLDSGATWNTIVSQLTNNGSTTQSVSWLVPNGITSTKALIKVCDYYNPTTTFDISNAVFNISPSNDITVTSPNGGESWVGLSTHTLTWTNLPTASGQYSIYYSTDGGSTWTNIASNIIGNAYSWTLPNIPSTQCLIKVMDYVNTCKYDVSNSYFTITPAAPILLTPNGGELYYAGYTASITWNTSTFYTTVKLDYSLDSGQTWINIIAATSNNGSYSWVVPNVYSTKCLVKASNSSNTLYYDISNAVFTLKPAVTIITPNGSSDSVIWGGCTNTSITFDRSTAYSNYKIEYSTNNGSTWNTIVSSWTASTSPATYNWAIPNIPGSANLVRVTPTSATSYYDQSDNTFTISKPITITYPNFGGTIQSGTIYNIKWQSDGISNIYDLYYSTNGGTTYTNITTAYNTSTNVYPWTVPAVSSTNCKIYIQDNLNTCKTDTSDYAFTITATAPSITVTSPNGGEHLVSGTTQSINWTSSGTSNNYNIDYTTNGGTTWVNIVSSYNTTSGTYLWTVPSVSTSLCLVRVTDAANNTKTDLSDASFYITIPPAPHASNNGPICVGNTLTLSGTTIANATYLWTGPNGFTSTSLNTTVSSNSTLNMAGKYYLAATVNAITGTDSTIVVINSLPNAPVKGTITQPTCSLATGSVILNSLPATGTWILNPGNISGTGTSKTLSGLSTGSYLYTVTNASGCTSGASDTITINTQPQVPTTPSVQSIIQPTCNVATGSVSLNNLPSTGTWTINPGNISGTGTTTTITSLTTGTYNFTVTTLPSCTSSATNDVVINAQPQAQSAPIVQSITQPTCTDSNSTVVLSGLPATGTWTLNPGSITGTGTSKTITGLTSGTYTYTVTNALNCTSVASGNIVINTQPQTPAKSNVQSITQPTCNVATGSIVLNALPVSGTWTINPGNISGVGTTKTISNLTSGTYNFTVTNASGCTSNASDDAVVNVQPPTQTTPVVQSITQSTCSDPNSIVILSGLPSTGTWTLNPGNISGSGTSKSITGLTVGTYNYTVTNASGCTSLASANIVINDQPQTPSAPVVQTINQPTCSSATASIVLNGLPSTGNWVLNPGNISGSGASTTLTSLTAGTYSYTVTNASACKSVASANTVINSQPLTPTVPTVGSITQPTCSLATGSVVLSDLPASGNWTINPGSISGSGTSIALTGITAGIHNYTVTNASLCTSTATTNVVINAQPATPTAPVVGTITQPTCIDATGSVVLTGLPATGTWTLNPGSISGTGTTKTITLLTTGTYAYSVTNAAGCTSSVSNNIDINTQPLTPATPVVQTVNQPTCSTATGSIALSNLPSSGTWILNPGNISGSGTTTTLSALTAGTFSYTVTNSSTCTSAATASVVINSQPITPVAPVVGTITQPNCVSATGSVVLNGLPSTGNWILNPGSVNGSGTSITIPNLTAGTFNYTVTNASNCTSSASANIVINTQPAAPTTPIVGTITQPTCNLATGNVALSGLPSTGNWVINPGNISGSGSTITLTGLTPNTYNYTVSNGANCISTATANVTINAQPTVPTAPIVGTITQPTCTSDTASVVLTGLPATGTWIVNPGNINGSGTTISLSNLNNGIYNYSVTNDMACTSATSTNVVINAQPTTPIADSAIKGPLNVCQGQTNVNYTIPDILNATSYVWTLPTGVTGSSTTSNIYLNFSTTATSGYIMVKGVNACGEGNNSIIEVTVNTIPATPIIIQSGDTLTSNAPLGNQWYSSTTGIINGATNQVFIPLQAGYYFDIVTLNDCSSDSSNIIHFDNTGIEANEIDMTVKVYPNPAKDKLTIETNLNTEQKLEIINFIGQTVYTAMINKKATINTSAFANGVYILKLYTDKVIVTRKFVKEQ